MTLELCLHDISEIEHLMEELELVTDIHPILEVKSIINKKKI